MVDILHRVGIATPNLDAVYEALTTRNGLAGWWTTDTEGDFGLGDVIRFRFTGDGFDMRVVELATASHVRWEVVDGPSEWFGTTIDWQLRQDGDYVIVLFRHQGWREPVEFMHHCSTKWGVFLLSLKELVESGKGSPHPTDVKIDNWN